VLRSWPSAPRRPPTFGTEFGAGIGGLAISLASSLRSTFSFGLPGLRSTASSVLCRCWTPRCRACGSYSSSLSPTVPLLTRGGRPQGLGSHVPRGPRVSVHAWGLPLRSVPVTYLQMSYATVLPSSCLPVSLTRSALLVNFFTASRRFIPTHPS
jgi:hypothetical protein